MKIAQIVTKYLGHLCKKKCRRELSKIAQSGHTADRLLELPTTGNDNSENADQIFDNKIEILGRVSEKSRSIFINQIIQFLQQCENVP